MVKDAAMLFCVCACVCVNKAWKVRGRLSWRLRFLNRTVVLRNAITP